MRVCAPEGEMRLLPTESPEGGETPRGQGKPKEAREETLKAGRSGELFRRRRVKLLAHTKHSGLGIRLQGWSKPERGAGPARDEEPAIRRIPADGAVGVVLVMRTGRGGGMETLRGG